MNEEASLLHTSPQLPIPGRWIPIAHPPGSLPDLVPDLSQALLIDVRCEANSSPHDCAANVASAVAQSGGTALYGWNLTQFHSSRENASLIEATPHIAWQPPEGAPVDVTPPASPNTMQSCFVPAGRSWKVPPNSLFFVPQKTSQITITELRQILEAKHNARKYMQKLDLVAGSRAVIDMQHLHTYCRSHIKGDHFDTVFQFVRLELVRLKVIG
jgi:hypothetical protein